MSDHELFRSEKHCVEWSKDQDVGVDNEQLPIPCPAPHFQLVCRGNARQELRCTTNRHVFVRKWLPRGLRDRRHGIPEQ
eukprot:3521279-Prymnesium_polylepis.2